MRLQPTIGLLAALSLLLGACSPAPAAAPTAAPAAAPTQAPAVKPSAAPSAAAPSAAPSAAPKPSAAAVSASPSPGLAASPSPAASPSAVGAAAATPATAAAPTQAAAAAAGPPLSVDFTLDLRYGVLAGLTGDAAAFGQPWNQATKIAIDYINQDLTQLGLSDKIKLTLVDSQDSGGNAQQGVEAAKKLVDIDHTNVMIGDFFSASTSAVAASVTVPGKVLEFTGGTNPSLTKLNPAGGPTYLWQPVAADDLQGKVLAQLMGDAFGKTATVNVGIRNDAYGNGLGDVFKAAWTAQGGTIGKYVIYNPTQPTYDTEAQQLVDGNPDGWLFVDFCANWVKLVGPLQRTGKWDGAKTFGGDSLTDCGGQGNTPQAAVPGMRSTAANAASGTSFKDYEDLFQSKAAPGLTWNPGTSEAFDSVFVAFVAALDAKSDDPTKISASIVKVTNPPAQDYSFTQLPDVIRAVLAGQAVHFNGAGGALDFEPGGRVTASAYDVWQVHPDGSASILNTVIYKG